MTGRLGRRSGAAAALVTAVLISTGAGPASARAADSGPTITFDQPAPDTVSASSSVTTSGSVAVDAVLYRLGDLTVTIAGKSFTVTCSDSPCPFRETVVLPLNGPYDVTVSASEQTVLLGTPGPTGTAKRSFAVAVAPEKPVLDQPKVDDSRNVNLTWTRNTEGDMLYYAVFRRDPGSTKYTQVGGKVAQPSSGKSVSFTDTTTSLFDGGGYAYQVVAVRKGATGTAASEKSSDPAVAVIATVPPAPTTTVAGPGAPGGGPGTTAKPGPPGGVDLSSFLSTRSQPVKLSPITVPDPPDPGFSNKLPFGTSPGDDVEPGDPAAVAPAQKKSTSVVAAGSVGRPLVPVAGGLILLLLALHVRMLNRRVKQAPDDLPVDLAAVAAPAATAPPPTPKAAPVPYLYDFQDDEDPAEEPEPAPAPDEVWAPVAAVDPEPEPEPEPEPDFGLDFDLDDLDHLDDFDDVALEPELEPEPAAAAAAAAEEVDVLPTTADPDEIEVVDVVAPNRRRLVRAGSR